MIIRGKIAAWELTLRDSIFGGLDAVLEPAKGAPRLWSICTIHVPEGTAAEAIRAARRTTRRTEAELVARAVCAGLGGRWLPKKS